MDPSTSELAQLTSVEAVLQWIGIANRAGPPAENFKDAFMAALGNPSLLRHIVAIPEARYQKVCTELQVECTTPAAGSTPEVKVSRGLTPVEEGQAGEVQRIARLALGLPATDTGPFPTQGGNAPQAEGRRIKMSMVIDQGDDSEVRPLGTEVLRNLLQEWKVKHNDNEDPAEEEEATGDQLSALDSRIRSGATPFVDMGVWRPYGARLGRALKFEAIVPLPNGGWQRREHSGPSSK